MCLKTIQFWFVLTLITALCGWGCSPSDVISMEEARAEFALRCERKACFCGVDEEICSSLGIFDPQNNSEVFRMDLVDCIYEFDIQDCTDFGVTIPESCSQLRQR